MAGNFPVPFLFVSLGSAENCYLVTSFFGFCFDTDNKRLSTRSGSTQAGACGVRLDLNVVFNDLVVSGKALLSFTQNELQ